MNDPFECNWTEEAIYHEGDRFFSSLIQAISEAKETIDLETYLFDQDELGNKLISALATAAEKGVRIRVLLDGFGCSQWNYAELTRLRANGIQARFFHPLPWQIKPHQIWKRLSLRRVLLGFWKLNRRNHRKTCIIDSKAAFLGGMNISSRHLASLSGPEAWRDTSVRVTGNGILLLSDAFEQAWAKPNKLHQRARAADFPLRLNVTRKQRRASYADLTTRVMNAERRVWITNPYFIPEYSLVRALRLAAWNGVDVRILVPRRTDIPGFHWAIRAFYFVLLAAKVRIFEYQPTILHAKIVVIDDWICVGSSNLNPRSLLHDLEVDVILSWPASLVSIEKQYLQDLDRSLEVDPRTWHKRSWTKKLFERFALLFRKWL